MSHCSDGDVLRVLPVMNKFAEANINIDLKLIMRDEHLDIMDAFLSNGSRSIPTLIVIDQPGEDDDDDDDADDDDDDDDDDEDDDDEDDDDDDEEDDG